MGGEAGVIGQGLAVRASETSSWLIRNAWSDQQNGSWVEDLGRELAPRSIYGSEHLPTSAVAADLDRDGDLDVVSTHMDYVGGKNLVWHENTPQGFVDHLIAGSEHGAQRVAVADLDGDGDLDLALATETSGVTVWTNDGKQRFTRKSIPTAVSYALRIQAADLNRDGRIDLVASDVHGKVAFLANAGRGRFEERLVETGYEYAVIDPLAADLDGDGDLDLLLTVTDREDQSLSVLENKGQGFELRSLGLQLVSAADAAALDLDRDGDLDLVASVSQRSADGAVHGALVWLENQGQLRFSLHPISSSPERGGELSVGDLNGDGNVDFLWQTPGSTVAASWYERKADGAFVGHPLKQGALCGAGSLADLDGDGDLDLISVVDGVLLCQGYADGVRLHQRAWGKTDAWLIRHGKAEAIEKGRSYLVRLEARDSAAHPLASLEVGLADRWDVHGPHLVQGLVKVPGPFSAKGFAGHRAILHAEASGALFPVLRLGWSAQSGEQPEPAFRGIAFTELTDQLAFALSPLAVVAGQVHTAVVSYSAARDRDIRVDLIDGDRFVAGVQIQVPAGEGRVSVPVSVPAGVAQSDALVWYAKLLPRGGQWFEKISEVGASTRLAAIQGTPIPASALFFDAPIYALEGELVGPSPSPHAMTSRARVGRIELDPILGGFGVAITGRSGDPFGQDYLFDLRTGRAVGISHRFYLPEGDPGRTTRTELMPGQPGYLEMVGAIRAVLNTIFLPYPYPYPDPFVPGHPALGSTVHYFDRLLASLI